MDPVQAHCRAGLGCSGLLAAVVLVLLAYPLPATSEPGEQAVRCRFTSGFEAIYLITPALARVRRADVRPTRLGRLEAESGEYRLVFDAGRGMRSVTIIDRATGAARRVFGERARMRRTFDQAGADDGLVREAGSCRVRFGRLD